jgi:hypothetical protein
LTVFVPNLTPGFEFSAGLLILQPGANNLGYATVTTFLPLANPQWAVQVLDPDYQAGFCVGGRYVFPCSGNDIQINWEHLRTSDCVLPADVQFRRASQPRHTGSLASPRPLGADDPGTTTGARLIGIDSATTPTPFAQ